MRRQVFFSLFIACAFSPMVASAHALPVDSSPEAGAVLTAAPQEVSITFSERVDQSASAIVVSDPHGTTVSHGDASVVGDAHILAVPMQGDGDGAYIVSWSTVSADDGHFTRGSFAFAVGSAAALDAVAASSTNSGEVVEIAGTPEALAMTVELMGHGFLWAVLLLFAFGLRPLMKDALPKEKRQVERILLWCASLACLFAISGGLAQLVIKSQELAAIRLSTVAQTLPLYFGTSAGGATLHRMLAASVFIVLYLVARKKIYAATRWTLSEYGLLLALVIFALERARISHATSNPFHPWFSVLVNFFHVIEKDIWAGIVGMLLLLLVVPQTRQLARFVLPRAFAMLAVDFGLVSITACYIVWLHLKSFDNLFSTQWGGAFLELLSMAIILVALRLYHVFARLWRPTLFARVLPITLAAEFAIAMLVVYTSSVVIITSPPLLTPPTAVFTAHDQGLTIQLQRDYNEDGMLILTALGGSAETPVLTANDTSISLSQRFVGGYVFPAAFLSGSGPFAIDITVPQQKAYDAHAQFVVHQGDFTPAPGWQATRPLDMFTITMLLLALAALECSVVVYRLSRRKHIPHERAYGSFVMVQAGVVLLIASFFGAGIIGTLHNAPLENPFAFECNGDGNMWHLMEPTTAGKALSQTPVEGCMWGMGRYLYMFPDQREYDYYKELGHADVSLTTAPQQLLAGVPSVLAVSLKNQDGVPATLFVDMEKIIHVVIVSYDENVFAHIHPDDLHPLTQQEIESSTFTLNYTFPKAGDYLIAVDYAHGVALESKEFTVHVGGAPAQSTTTAEYPTEGDFSGYHVSLKYALPLAGQVETLYYTITKNGQPVVLVPYLSAAMHVAVVKNDFSWYLHAHGEVHPPGAPLPPIIVKNGQVIHSMAMMVVPDQFQLPVDAHIIFPSAGLYTVWGQFKTQSGDLVASAFTVRVESH